MVRYGLFTVPLIACFLFFPLNAVLLRPAVAAITVYTYGAGSEAYGDPAGSRDEIDLTAEPADEPAEREEDFQQPPGQYTTEEPGTIEHPGDGNGEEVRPEEAPQTPEEDNGETWEIPVDQEGEH